MIIPKYFDPIVIPPTGGYEMRPLGFAVAILISVAACSPPRPLEHPRPQYPDMLSAAKLGGTVIARLNVDRRGPGQKHHGRFRDARARAVPGERAERAAIRSVPPGAVVRHRAPGLVQVFNPVRSCRARAGWLSVSSAVERGQSGRLSARPQRFRPRGLRGPGRPPRGHSVIATIRLTNPAADKREHVGRIAVERLARCQCTRAGEPHIEPTACS